MTRALGKLGVLIAVSVLLTGCAAGRAYRAGGVAMRADDFDQAVAFYRVAVKSSPDNANYKIALERASQAASRAHFERARQFETQDQLDAARSEYRLAAEYDQTNQTALSKVAALDQIIRERNEAARPRPAIEQLRAQARAAAAPPLLNPSSRDPIRFQANNTSLRDTLNFLGNAYGINITYDRDFQDRAITVNLDGIPFETALTILMTMNQYSYKVLNERSIFVFQDIAGKHLIYDDQVIQTFYVSHADVAELSQLISAIIRIPGIAVQPAIQFNKVNNTLTIRATTAIAQIIERLIQQNDKPRAEIVVDVEILEVNRNRVKQYGLNLSEYAIGTVFSPEVSPGLTSTTSPTTPTTPGTTPTTPTTTTSGRSTSPSGVSSPPPFNLNTITQGVSTADFYLAVPTALVRALESDTNSKLIAKPQLRGAEGSKMSLKLGDSIPIIQTSYTPLATGGAGVNPLSSYNYKDIGVNVDITPKVTLEGDILMDLTVENLSLGSPISVAGVSVPSFGQRSVTAKLRLRDGESNLLAGLLREDERRSLSGFPGAIHLPVLQQLFSSNDNVIQTTDIVMLLTPHIIRTSEITADDLKPIFIGSQQNFGVGGAPPLIAAVPEPEATQPPPPALAATAPAAAPGTIAAPGGVTVGPPPGTTPIPGTVVLPTPAPSPAPPTPAPPAPTAAPVPPQPTAPLPPTTGATTPPVTPPATQPPPTAAVGSALVTVTTPGTNWRVGTGPYTVPLMIANVSRLSTLSLTLTFDPAVVRIRSVQEGSFMRSGGVNVTFAQQQPSPGRLDITIARTGDGTGASGTGLLAGLSLEPVAPGMTTLSLNGAATGPGGTVMGLQFRPATVAVQP